MTSSWNYGTTPVYVSEGQTVRFRYKAPALWDTTTSVTIQIGLQTTVWYISTVPEEFAPDPFPFRDLDNAEPDTAYVYGDGNRVGESVVVISGLSTDTEINVGLTTSHVNPTIDDVAIRKWRVSQNETAWGPWTARNALQGWVVENTDKLQIRLKSNSVNSQSHYANLTCGNRTEKWTIKTKDLAPNFPDPAPQFDWLEDQPLDTDIYSNRVQIQGMNSIGLVTTDNNAKIGISSDPLGAYTTNDNGFDVLTGVTFVDSSTNPTIFNGQWIQLMVRSASTAQTAISNIVTIGNGGTPAVWRVETGDAPSDTPGSFFFTNLLDVDEDTLIESDQKPNGGMTGLGTDVSADVVLVSTTGSAPGVRIKHDGSWSSWGIFPTSVVLGDEIQIRNKSDATFGGVISTTIKVGSLPIAAWTITTNNGPDTDANFDPPADLTNRAPGSTVISSIVTVTEINRPITINATNGAKISLDFGTFVTGPVTFDPDENTVFQLQMVTPSTGGVGDIGLDQSVNTVVTVGTGTSNNPFTWTATNYENAPPPPELKGCWYSKKTAFVDMSGGGQGVIRQNKEDGYAIGTVIPILKDITDASESDPMDQYGELKGTTAKGRLDAKYPGYLDCDGEQYDVADFPDLWNVIGNIYAKPDDDANDFGEWNNTTKVYTGKFRVPDYRNRRMVGPGQVDGNKGSSTILPIQTGIHPEKTFNARESGGIGGYWYVDSVDVTAGDPNPYQQIIGDDPQDTEGITSDFFNFGTVRTEVLEDIVVDIEFTVAGDVTATIGPLREVLVKVPRHDHMYIAAQTEGDGGDPLISWDTPALFGYTPYGFTNDKAVNSWIGDKLGRVAWPGTSSLDDLAWPTNDLGDQPIPAPPKLYWNNPKSTSDFSPTTVGTITTQWLNILRDYMPNFQSEWDNLIGVGSGDIKELEDIIKDDLMGNGDQGWLDENHPADKDTVAYTISAKTWWVNPGDLVPDSYFKDLEVPGLTDAVYSRGSSMLAGTAGTSTYGSIDQTYNATAGAFDVWNAKVMATIDTTSSIFRVKNYTAPLIHEDADVSGESYGTDPARHTHYLTEFPILDPKVDFSYGNVNSAGHKQGLGTGVTKTRPITFNQSDVLLELNTGTFTLNKGVKLPAPNVKFKPNRKVELVPEFHKVKYIIKAF